MPKVQLLYYATDKDLFDALFSARQHFSEATLRGLARTRGLYYSQEEERLALTDALSKLIFGFIEVTEIQKESERSGRGERTASFRMKTTLTSDEIKAIAAEFVQAASADGESVSSFLRGESGVALDIKYNELDLSRTTLRQLQKRQAHIDLKTVDGETVISYPSTEKAAAFAKSLSKRINSVRSSMIEVEEVDFSTFNGPKAKSEFFYKLVTTLPGFRLENVTNLKVDSNTERPAYDPSDQDLLGTNLVNGDAYDGLAESSASNDMLAVVKAVALQGQSLLMSTEYQNLQRRGFFISKIQWSAKRISSPYQIVEFNASFDDPAVGCGFVYSVRGWSTQKNGVYTKGFNSIPTDDKKVLMQLLEQRSMALFCELRARTFAEAEQEPAEDQFGGISFEGGQA